MALENPPTHTMVTKGDEEPQEEEVLAKKSEPDEELEQMTPIPEDMTATGEVKTPTKEVWHYYPRHSPRSWRGTRCLM